MAKRGNPAWQKGIKSPNPSGRGKDTLGELLRSMPNIPEKILAAVLPLLNSRDEKIRLSAAEFLADRRDGRPMQSVQHSGEDGGPIKFEMVNYANYTTTI